MEPSQCNELELTDMLYAEVTQKLAALEETLTTQGIIRNGHPHTALGNPLTMEQHALLAAHLWWEKAHKDLAEARAAIAEAEAYEHQRAASSTH